MALLIASLVLTIISVAINRLLAERYRWSKTVLMGLTIVGAAVSFWQGYRSLERAAALQTTLKVVEAKAVHAECVQSQMTNRHLTTQQRATLSSELAAFPGVIVNIWRFTGTPGSQTVISFELETIRFAGELTEVFRAAKWHTNGVIVRQHPFPDFPQSVFIMQRKDADSRIDKAVKALVAGLDADCIKVDVGPPFPDNGDYGQKIFIDNSGSHPDTVQAGIISPTRPQKNPDISILVGDAL